MKTMGSLWTMTRRLDAATVFSMGALATIGVLFIFSAAYTSAEDAVAPFYRRQILWLLVGAPVFLAAALSDYRRWSRYALGFYAVTLLSLVLVLLMGRGVRASQRWLAVLGFQFQPSEFAKLAFIAMLALFLSRPERDLHAPLETVKALLWMLLPLVLILRQPDLGTAMILVPVTFVMLLAAGVPVRVLAFFALLGCMLLPLGWLGLDTYQKERLLVFMEPGRDPLGAGWNKMQSQIAVGSGGLWGKGYLQGTQNVLGFLPRPVAPTDFIFSVIAEERGFVGGVLVLSLYALLLLRSWRAAERAPDRLGALLVTGCATLLFCHVFINIAMTIGWLPVTGLPLPLISYGGSFMLSTLMALGIIQSVYLRRLRR